MTTFSEIPLDHNAPDLHTWRGYFILFDNCPGIEQAHACAYDSNDALKCIYLDPETIEMIRQEAEPASLQAA